MMTDGGIWWRAPISAFCKKPGVKELPLNELMLWDSFSYNVSVTRFYQLQGCKMIYTSRRKKQREGTYLFTIDWCAGDYNELDFGYAEKPDQHKCGHVIELDDGNYAIQPNNRLRIFDPSMAADPSKPLIHRLVNTRIWSVEDTSKWITDEDQEGSYDYEYKEIKDGEEKSTVNKAGNYTKPGMRKRIFNSKMAGSKGGKPGQWSARKAQMLAKKI